MAMVLLGGLTGPPVDQAQADGRLARTLQAIQARFGVPGLAVLTVDASGVRDAMALGYAERAQDRPMTVDTLVRIGSITKTFNAIGLLRLAAEGRLSLDARLADLAPGLPLDNPWQAAHPVRLIHLLEHTAGLMDMSRAEFAHNQPFASLRAAFDFAPEERRVHWPAGLHTQYSNVGSGYLGYVIEQISGLPYAAFMREQVLAPMGLASATLTDDEATLQRLAVGYDSDGRSVIPYWHMVFPPMGAINATPRAMARLPRLFLGRGTLDGERLLDAAAVAFMETPQSSLAARAGLRFGYGAGLDQEIDDGRVWYGHEGDGDGYLSHFAYQKDLGVGYFLTLNAFKRDALLELGGAVRAHLAEGHAPAAPGPAATASTPPSATVGDYQPLTRRFAWDSGGRLSVVRRNGGLALVYPGGRRRPLLAVAEQLYRHPEHPVATIAIVDLDGCPVLQGAFGSFGRIGCPAP